MLPEIVVSDASETIVTLPQVDKTEEALSTGSFDSLDTQVNPTEETISFSQIDISPTDTDEIIIETPTTQSEELFFQEKPIDMLDNNTQTIASENSTRTVFVDGDKVTIVWK